MVVLDGWGEANPDKYNCIHVAETPVMDSLKNVNFESTFRILFFSSFCLVKDVIFMGFLDLFVINCKGCS